MVSYAMPDSPEIDTPYLGYAQLMTRADRALKRALEASALASAAETRQGRAAMVAQALLDARKAVATLERVRP